MKGLQVGEMLLWSRASQVDRVREVRVPRGQATGDGTAQVTGKGLH